MSVSLSLGGGNVLSPGNLADLKHEAETLLKLGPEFLPYLSSPLSALPANFQNTAVQYTSGNQTWAPGPITFTLSAGVSGKVSVRSSGDLLTYTAALPTEVIFGSASAATTASDAGINAAVPLPEGLQYLVVELDFEISGGLSGNYSSGVYGVCTANTGAASVTVACYVACDPAMSLESALMQGFERFVLPLHASTLANLAPGDYLHYNFNGSLELGMGASVGFDKVSYAGQYTSDIPKTAGAVQLDASVKPEIQAGAKLAFSYDYTGSFEMLLWRNASGQARLHLYRSQLQDTTLGLQLGARLTTGSAASVSTMTDQVATTFTQALPDPLQSVFTTRVLTPCFKEVQKYTDELNGKLCSWLARTNDQKCAMDLAIEHVSDRFLLTDYTVDLTQDYVPAWEDMLAGRFLSAIERAGSGVSLAAGSGTEGLFTSASSIKLNLFGAFHASWTTEILSNTSLIYAGNRTFHLVTNQGRELLSSINGGKKQIDIYFSAEADVTAGTTVSPVIQLNVVLQATDDATFGAYIGRIVGLLASGPAGAALASGVSRLAAQRGAVETLHLVFSPQAYGRLRAATMVKHKPVNEALDMPNYAAFAKACAQVFNSQPSTFTWNGTPLSYAMWRESNIASNDTFPAPDGALPDRTGSAGYNPFAASQLEEILPGIGMEAQGVFYCFTAAAKFMCLCEDLADLAIQGAVSLDTWTNLVQQLKMIIRNDVSPYFIAPSTLALAALCGGAPEVVRGPAANLPSGPSIAATLTF